MTTPTPQTPQISGLEDCAYYFDREGAPKDAECCRNAAWLIVSHSETIDSLKRDLAAAQSELADMSILLDNERTAVAVLDAELAEALAWSDRDMPIPEDEQIKASHPVVANTHAQWREAMRMVGAKRSKGALVGLVCWLLQRADAAERELAQVKDDFDTAIERRDEWKRDAARWRMAREPDFGIADWTEFAKPLVMRGASADQRIDRAIAAKKVLP